MDIFKELLSLLTKEYDLYNYQLEDIEREIYKYDEIKRIIELMNKKDKLFLHQVINIVNYYPELSDYINLLTELESMYELINQGSYSEVLPDRIRMVLAGSDADSKEIEKVLKDVTLCDKLKYYVEMSDADMKIVDIVKHTHFDILNYFSKSFENVFNKLASEIKTRYSVLGSVEILKSRKDNLKRELDEITRFKKLFNENGLIDDISRDDLELFYEWLSNTKFTKKIDVIKNIVLKQIKGRDKTEEEIVSENRQQVINRIQNVISSKSITFDTLDLSSFTGEEINIILEIKKIYINKSSQCSERVSFSNEELGNRQESYFHNNNVEWAIVLADIENNLLPNILTNRSNVINVFKYIIEVYNKEIQYNNYLVTLSEKKKLLNNYVEELKKMFNMDNLYDTTYDYLFQEGARSNDPRYDDKYNYYDIRYFIRNDVQAFVMNIEKELIIIDSIISGERNYNEAMSFEEIKQRYDELMLQYHEKWDAYIEYEKRRYEELEESDDNFLQKENLVFCINGVSFDDDFSNYDVGKEKEFNSTVKSLETIRYDILRKPLGRKALEKILYRPSSKTKMRKHKIKKVLTNFKNAYFTPYRYSGTGYYRTGLIMFSLCKENKEKLQQIYNLKDSFAVFAIFKIILAERDNHEKYSDFVEYIKKNEEKLEDIGELFLDPNTDIQVLCNIIDKGLEYRENLRKHGGTK